MKNTLAISLICLFLSLNSFAEGKGPEIRIIDDKVSIQAESVPLARLLKLLDRVTGLNSKVPPELANRNVSVRFSDLKFDEAIARIFEGLPLDYVLIQGQGIVVTGNSQAVTATAGGPVPFNPPAQESVVEDNPFSPQSPFGGAVGTQPMPGFGGNPNVNNPNQPPATIQTMFGTIPNPRANQPAQQPGPMVVPGQQQQLNPINGVGNAVFGNPPGTTTNTLPANTPFGSNPVFPQPGAPTNVAPQTLPPGYQLPLPPQTRPIP